MKDWLRVNWKPAAAVVLMTALYVIAKWFPEASLERQYLEGLGQLLGIPMIALVPGVRKRRRKGDGQ